MEGSVIKKLEIASRELCEIISSVEDVDERIDAINKIRMMISEVSPLKHHPVDCVVWERSDMVEGNEYNPNSVAPPEMKLLNRSIEADGYTMPIVTFDSRKECGKIKIVDGFHRRKCEVTNSNISESTHGRIPITFIRSECSDISDRMASTIRHNRARGTHSIDLMVNIVKDLTDSGMGNEWIMKNIGMNADELLRLKQISGLAELFKDKDFSTSWTSEE